MKLVPVLLAAAVVLAADPRIVYTKSFPGSTPAYVSITAEKDGSVAYKESADDEPETFKIEPGAAAAMFDLAEKLGRFKSPLESGLKVANMGQKTFRWENGSEKNEAKFNYSLDENARLLHDWFERITETEALVLQLRRAVRYDRLGVNDAVLKIHAAWDRKRLVGLEQLLPLLDRVASNESLINMARERARALAEVFRATLQAPPQ
jgi:hypothetical protein